MTRPRLLDLFCGAGGAAMGYHRAGFDVVGVDINPQPRYPFEFHQDDVFNYLSVAPWDWDAVHASPPCQDHTTIGPRIDHGTGWMLDATRQVLAQIGLPWVIENVGAAAMRADFLLCGSMFGLRTYRHRRFELDPRIPQLLALPPHPRHRTLTSRNKRRSHFAQGFNMTITGDVDLDVASACLGIDWMDAREIVQAIPPAYTEYIGRQLMEYLSGP